MTKIAIGKADGVTVYLDLDALLRGRLLIQANSGAGKSYLIRKVAEELFGKVQVIIIDAEGEFATLREHFGYVLVGKGGETPADPRSAALVAHKLLELRASAVCDLYEMKAFQRHEFVQKFLEAMIDAPKNLWHPCVVIVDEAHIFCPEKGAGESVAAEAVIGMATRGRKRGFALVLATQRLGKLRKDAAAELLNLLIGKTFIDVDRKRAADALGVYGGKDLHDFFDQIKLLERGNFYALGPALSDERKLVQIGSVKTTHAEAGSAKHGAEPPPAPEAIAKLLPKLSDLPKQAEEKAKTEADLRAEIRSLKAQLRTQPTATKEVPVVDQKAIERALQKQRADYDRILKAADNANREGLRVLVQIRDIATKATSIFGEPIKMPTATPMTATAPTPVTRVTVTAPAVRAPQVEHHLESNGELDGPKRKILKALAELKSIGKDRPSKAMVAGWSSYSVNGGGFRNPLGALNTGGYVTYPDGDSVALTEKGEMAAGVLEPPDAAEIRRRIEAICDGPERKILGALLEHGREEISKEDLAARSGYAVDGGGFRNPLGALRTKGLLDYPQPETVKAAEWIFLD